MDPHTTCRLCEQAVLRALGFLEDDPNKLLLGVTATPYRCVYFVLHAQASVLMCTGVPARVPATPYRFVYLLYLHCMPKQVHLRAQANVNGSSTSTLQGAELNVLVHAAPPLLGATSFS